MTVTPKYYLSFAFSFVVALFAMVAAGPARAQDSTRTVMEPAEVMTDVLNLKDPALSIWPDVNVVEIEALSSTVSDLLGAYEADRLDSDERTRLIEAMIVESEKDEELLKAQIKLAKEAGDEAAKKSLEDLLELYQMRRKYLVRIAGLRAEERVLAESRIDYVGQLEDVLTIAREFVAARESGDQAELLGTERELIRQSRELGVRLDAVASSLKKVNSSRDKAFDEREKLISVAD